MPCDTVGLLFYLFSVATFVGIGEYFHRIYNRIPENQTAPADEESRKMYFETFKTLITAAGLAIAIISATLKSLPSNTLWMLQRGAIALLAAVAFSVITLLEMSRRYERSRQADRQSPELLATTASAINAAIQKGKSVSDYTEALKLAVDYCRQETLTPGLPKPGLGWLCIWAYLSTVSFIIGLLYVVRFVNCF
jgi:hypothetical protein